MRFGSLLFSIFLTTSTSVFSQQAVYSGEDSAYLRTIASRSEKIVATLEISDLPKAKRVSTTISDQYRNLNQVYIWRDGQIKRIKEKSGPKDSETEEIKSVENAAEVKVRALHEQFLSALHSELTPEQVIRVKDGMTYNVLNVTYTAFVDMIPKLTKEQKDQIMAWLIEAREYAMDAESSDKKHWWFGKYKGRINNYLSAQGYDLQKERKEWEQRQKKKE